MLMLVYRRSSIFELHYGSAGRAASFFTYILTSNALKKGLRLIDLIASIAAVYFIFTNDVLFRWLNNLVTYQVKLVIFFKFEYKKDQGLQNCFE
jgi:hypothetical protein